MPKFGEIQNVHCRMFWKPNGIAVDYPALL